MLLHTVIFALRGPTQRQHWVFTWRVEYQSLRMNLTVEVKGNIWRSDRCIFMILEEDLVRVYCRPFFGAAWKVWGHIGGQF